MYGQADSRAAEPRSTETPGNVILRLLLRGICENLFGPGELDQLAEVKERRVVRAAARLLHVVRDDDDGVFALQLLDQFLDF